MPFGLNMAQADRPPRRRRHCQPPRIGRPRGQPEHRHRRELHRPQRQTGERVDQDAVASLRHLPGRADRHAAEAREEGPPGLRRGQAPDPALAQGRRGLRPPSRPRSCWSPAGACSSSTSRPAPTATAPRPPTLSRRPPPMRPRPTRTTDPVSPSRPIAETVKPAGLIPCGLSLPPISTLQIFSSRHRFGGPLPPADLGRFRVPPARDRPFLSLLPWASPSRQRVRGVRFARDPRGDRDEIAPQSRHPQRSTNHEDDLRHVDQGRRFPQDRPPRPRSR